MFRAKKILVAVDFSETSERAVDSAVAIAARFDGKVIIAHAYEIPTLGFPEGVLVATSDVVSRISNAAEGALVELAKRAEKDSGGRVPIETVLRTGVPYETMTALGDELDVDLLVIGTHARRGIARALLGSVAENIIRTSTRPVLVIHGPRDEDEQKR